MFSSIVWKHLADCHQTWQTALGIWPPSTLTTMSKNSGYNEVIMKVGGHRTSPVNVFNVFQAWMAWFGSNSTWVILIKQSAMTTNAMTSFHLLTRSKWRPNDKKHPRFDVFIDISTSKPTIFFKRLCFLHHDCIDICEKLTVPQGLLLFFI